MSPWLRWCFQYSRDSWSRTKTKYREYSLDSTNRMTFLSIKRRIGIEILSPHAINIDSIKANKTKLLRIPVIGTDMPISQYRKYYKTEAMLLFHTHLTTFFAHERRSAIQSNNTVCVFIKHTSLKRTINLHKPLKFVVC